VEYSSIEEDVQVKKQQGALYVTSNSIGGNVQVEESSVGPFLVRNNLIDGDLQFFKNRGQGTITGNGVGGNLQSKENRPRPFISNNRVEGNTEIE
jgi:hypothetical protein